MSIQALLSNALENVASCIANLDTISTLIQQLTAANIKSLRDCLFVLENKMNDVDITLRTDIQILFNEIQCFIRLDKRKSVT